MKTRLVLCLVTAALLVASAKSFSIDLTRAARIGSSELKAGQYQIEVVDQKAVLTKGKVRVESPVTVGTANQKYTRTSVIFSDFYGNPRIQEIHVGGTNTKLVFE